jgi:2-amino-4-hydroxy-6-hydroxymethyldihydropteridine diphosphokinase
MNRSSDAWIGFGSNLGDRRAAIEEALQRLGSHPEIDVVACSTIRETAPVGVGPDHGLYLNGVVQIRTTLSPRMLLDACQTIEMDMGRQRQAGEILPRRMDLDLLMVDDHVCAEPNLILPHPEAATRHFVLEPLAELDPDLVIPGTDRSVTDLLREQVA